MVANDSWPHRADRVARRTALVDLVAQLCSERCAGRAPGTPEGDAARVVVNQALSRAGWTPTEQALPWCGGANVLAQRPGDIDRWVLIAAHFDHLGREGDRVYWGADDNAAAVAILVDVAAALGAQPAPGRGVIIASFDAEEPPYFLTDSMGSQHYARHPSVPLEQIDMMVCMDLVGHAIGPPEAPAEVRCSLFALGAERSTGTAAHVDRISRAASGLIVRRADAEVIPPLSDYLPFWQAQVPFLFLSCARWRHYHSPEDTPDKLDYDKMLATADWLEQFVRETCGRLDETIPFLPEGRDDAATLRTAADLTSALAASNEEARMGKLMAESLIAECDPAGRLPLERRRDVQRLIGMLESGLG